jgi:hypothetical protein
MNLALDIVYNNLIKYGTNHTYVYTNTILYFYAKYLGILNKKQSLERLRRNINSELKELGVNIEFHLTSKVEDNNDKFTSKIVYAQDEIEKITQANNKLHNEIVDAINALQEDILSNDVISYITEYFMRMGILEEYRSRYFYTPKAIADYMINLYMTEYKISCETPRTLANLDNKDWTMFDPACGTGSFIKAMHNRFMKIEAEIASKFKEANNDVFTLQTEILPKYPVRGANVNAFHWQDTDRQSLDLCALGLTMNDMTSANAFKCQNSLESFRGPIFDFVCCEPPRGFLRDTTCCKEIYDVNKDVATLEEAFIIYCLLSMKKITGRCCLLVPVEFMIYNPCDISTKRYDTTRNWMLKNFTLLRVIQVKNTETASLGDHYLDQCIIYLSSPSTINDVKDSSPLSDLTGAVITPRNRNKTTMFVDITTHYNKEEDIYYIKQGSTQKLSIVAGLIDPLAVQPKIVFGDYKQYLKLSQIVEFKDGVKCPSDTLSQYARYRVVGGGSANICSSQFNVIAPALIISKVTGRVFYSENENVFCHEGGIAISINKEKAMCVYIQYIYMCMKYLEQYLMHNAKQKLINEDFLTNIEIQDIPTHDQMQFVVSYKLSEYQSKKYKHQAKLLMRRAYDILDIHNNVLDN